MIKIITVQFSYDNDVRYEKLLKVLAYSAAVNMPGAEFISLTIPPPEMEQVPGYRMLKSNTSKLEKWAEEVDKADKNDRIVLLDSDMLIMRDFSKIFNFPFDICYTYRPENRLPLNGGVMFINPTEKAKIFFREFLSVNDRMLKNKKFHDPYRRIYAGMNQAAFGYMLENKTCLTNIHRIPCTLWNVCNEDWANIREDAYILHIKGRLRHMCLGTRHVSNDVKQLVDLWKYYDEMSND